MVIICHGIVSPVTLSTCLVWFPGYCIMCVGILCVIAFDVISCLVFSYLHESNLLLSLLFYCCLFVFSVHPYMFVLEVISCVPALACVYASILFRVFSGSGRSSSGVLVSVSFLLDLCKSLYFYGCLYNSTRQSHRLV